MPLTPQESIEHLRSHVAAFVRATGDRQEEAEGVQAAIAHVERQLSNFPHFSPKRVDDFALKDLYRNLVMEVELARGTLRQQPTARR
jgi:hypothetical protein